MAVAPCRPTLVLLLAAALSCGSVVPATVTVEAGARSPLANTTWTDFGDDGRSDVAVYRPSTGQWWVRGTFSARYGEPGDQPVVGDYNGDGRSDVAVFRPSTGQWWIRGQLMVVYGERGDIPVPADYDGDGRTDIAVYRPATGQWWIRGSLPVRYGEPGDVPAALDYDGDGRSDIAVFRPSTGQWWIRGQAMVGYGELGDLPVPSDYNDDGRSDIAVYRPTTGQWWIRGKPPVVYGEPGDQPVVGDYNGDGAADIAVFRPSTGQWWVRGQLMVVYGQSDDVALTSAPVRRHLPATVVWSGPATRRAIGLSFDAGSDPGSTAAILAILRQRHLHATFGLTGEWVTENPALARQIVAEGHQVVDHGAHHTSFTGLSTRTPPLTFAQRRAEVLGGEQAIRSVTGASVDGWFRPPYGDRDPSVERDLGALGYPVEVMWTVDSRGWRGVPAEEVVERCLSQAAPGRILLMHVGAASTDAAALAAVLDGLAARGYSVVTVHDLLLP